MISFIRYSPSAGNHELTAQLVECYRDVFASRPWNEWLQCLQCKRYWGTEDQEFLVSRKFRHHNRPLVDFWPREQVLTDLEHEITSEASCWLAMEGAMVVGFCWGYPITIAALERKIELSLSPDIHDGEPLPSARFRLLGASPQRLVAYQDEVGVLPPYRGRKIAKAMVQRRLADFRSQGLQVGVVRTREFPEPSTTFLWYTQKLGYEIIARYPGNDGRVILSRTLAGLPELLDL